MHEETFFTGGVFHESIDGGRAGAELELVHDGVKAVTTDGRRFLVKYSNAGSGLEPTVQSFIKEIEDEHIVDTGHIVAFDPAFRL
jgi:hypothetical protein